jgi:small subunit ribosomal protein S8
MSDVLSNFFSHIKNSQINRILVIKQPQSKIVMSVLNILQECGYIRGYRLSTYSEQERKNNDLSGSGVAKNFFFKKSKTPIPNTLVNFIDQRERKDVNNLNSISNFYIKESSQMITEADSLNQRAAVRGDIGMGKVEILLKYKNQKPAINNIIQISKPSKRFYISIKDLSSARGHSNNNLSPLLFMKGILILSTSKGIMTHLTAYRLNVGGEVLCHIS